MHIVDGHNRYEICRRLGIPFEVRERHFDNREGAIIWICANQLGRRNISDETRRYLIGKRYEAEKVIAGRRNYSGWNQYRKREQSGDLPYEVIEPDAQQERIRTSQRIGEEYHLAHGTVEKYGAYSKAVDKIAKKDPSMLPRILSGRYKISHENVLALSRMSQQEVKRFGRQMKAMRQSSRIPDDEISPHRSPLLSFLALAISQVHRRLRYRNRMQSSMQHSLETGQTDELQSQPHRHLHDTQSNESVYRPSCLDHDQNEMDICTCHFY